MPIFPFLTIHISLITYKILHPFWPFLFFFFFCFGGWRTTLIAASKTAFTFCIFWETFLQRLSMKRFFSLNTHTHTEATKLSFEKRRNLLCFCTTFNVSSSANQLFQLLTLQRKVRNKSQTLTLGGTRYINRYLAYDLLHKQGIDACSIPEPW